MAERQGRHESGKIAQTIQTHADVFDAFSKSKTKQNCFDHNFSKSAPIGPRFGIVTQFEAFLKMQWIAVRSGTLLAFQCGSKKNKHCVLLALSTRVFW